MYSQRRWLLVALVRVTLYVLFAGGNTFALESTLAFEHDGVVSWLRDGAGL